MDRSHRLVALLLGFAFVLGFARAVALIGHDPVYAIANSFDQARYTGCFDLFPDRPVPIRPDENSPNAPFEDYRYQANPVKLCYLSTELLPQALANGVYRVEAMATGTRTHSVRWMGTLRLVALTALAGWFCRAWWRRGNRFAASANAALFALVLTDPANTMYFNTFYAEATALTVAYALVNGVLLCWNQAPDRRRVLWLALGALLLSLSKIQHLVLPLALAVGVIAFGAWHRRTLPWQGAALLAGAILGALVQCGQLGRDDPMMRSIRSFNRAHVVFTGLLPAVRDPAPVIARLGLPAHCIAYVGKMAWQMPGMPEDVCPGIGQVGRLDVIGELAREPAAAIRYALNGLQALDPWLPKNLGHVEGAILGKLPAHHLTLNGVLRDAAPLRYLVFLLPFAGVVLALRRGDGMGLLAVLTATLMAATFTITLLGDGTADVAKQGHLIFNAALAFALVVSAGLVTATVRREGPHPMAPVPR
ncbi:hypothetical protein [Tahibacter amnicola]|uniref:Dolichyl-phosphate-mannose-protein mannosyltransferase n=1 Tax=Tahibacter amnicola TaxID=2976241 RepID=A0ABY6BHB1_9GAMM|nr:hypothetical protein [Tahibacter amnicola]UXI68713.1 hypothetical protein N4264_03410 [Tahibacter amnicola]